MNIKFSNDESPQGFSICRFILPPEEPPRSRQAARLLLLRPAPVRMSHGRNLVQPAHRLTSAGDA
eukprot:755143-Hanusia_phi.AAC.1